MLRSFLQKCYIQTFIYRLFSICFFSCSALNLTRKAPGCALFRGVIRGEHEEEI